MNLADGTPSTQHEVLTAEQANEIATEAQAVMSEISTVIEGKPEVVRIAMLVLLAGGHLLIEDIPGVGRRHRHVRPRLVEDHHLLGVPRRGFRAPRLPGYLIALGRPQRLFLWLQPVRAIVRHIVLTLTTCPVLAAHRA